MARARTVREERSAGIRAPEAKVLRKFVSLVSHLPFVEQVLAEPGYEGLQIWTVIDAEPFVDGPNDQVYEAELRASGAAPDALILYRLINRREYGDEKLAQVLPDRAHVAASRRPTLTCQRGRSTSPRPRAISG
jgi:hypothetical protein